MTNNSNTPPVGDKKPKPLTETEKLENLFTLTDAQLNYLTKQLTTKNKGYKNVRIIPKRVKMNCKAPDSPTTRIEHKMKNRGNVKRTYLPTEPDQGISKNIRWRKDIVSLHEYDETEISTVGHCEKFNAVKNSSLKSALKPPKVEELLIEERKDVIVTKFIYKS